MLVAFIHGVATKDVQYADQLKAFIREEFKKTPKNITHFLPIFWGNFLGDIEKMWNGIEKDLQVSGKDPVYYIRAMIDSLSQASPVKTNRKVYLKSITTMGSPIVFLNTMLDVRLEKIKEFAETYQEEPLRWINIIHSSDSVADPIRASLELDSHRNLDLSKKLFLQDEYVSTDANLAEKAARAVGQVDAAMAIGITDAHTGYWQCQQTARLVTNPIRGGDNLIGKVITRLSKVGGMTLDPNTHTEGEVFIFRDGSGTLRLVVNFFKVHHASIFDNSNNRQFGGYVGVIDTERLIQEIDFIKINFC